MFLSRKWESQKIRQYNLTLLPFFTSILTPEPNHPCTIFSSHLPSHVSNLPNGIVNRNVLPVSLWSSPAAALPKMERKALGSIRENVWEMVWESWPAGVDGGNAQLSMPVLVFLLRVKVVSRRKVTSLFFLSALKTREDPILIFSSDAKTNLSFYLFWLLPILTQITNVIDNEKTNN